MRRYSQEDEERIRAQAVVREWTRSGLLDRAQSAALEPELRVDVRRTNDFLRAGLALFTALIAGASVALVIEVFSLSRGWPIGVAAAAAAAAYFALADMLAGRFRFYRFGVEEALAACGVLLMAISGAEFISEPSYGLFGSAATVVSLIIGAAGALGVYHRFGFVYAAAASMACAAFLPFPMDLPAAVKHALAAAILASAFLIVRSLRQKYADDFRADEYALLQAAAFGGVYAALNLQLTWEHIDGPFCWFTYAMIWLLPAAAFVLAIREKDRPMLDVSLVAALMTLVTNKPYLGWTRHAWDPILLGLFLMAVAVIVRRWLSSGPGAERDGFTPAQVLTKDSRVLTALRVASTIYQPNEPSARPDSAPSGFDGGRSGGGGGGATY
jgi:hypothetical protein